MKRSLNHHDSEIPPAMLIAIGESAMESVKAIPDALKEIGVHVRCRIGLMRIADQCAIARIESPEELSTAKWDTFEEKDVYSRIVRMCGQVGATVRDAKRIKPTDDSLRRAYVLIGLNDPSVLDKVKKAIPLIRKAEPSMDVTVIATTGETAENCGPDRTWEETFKSLVEFLDQPIEYRGVRYSAAQRMYQLHGRNSDGEWLADPPALHRQVAHLIIQHGFSPYRGQLLRNQNSRIAITQSIRTCMGSAHVKVISASIQKGLAYALAGQELSHLDADVLTEQDKKRVVKATEDLVRSIHVKWTRFLWEKMDREPADHDHGRINACANDACEKLIEEVTREKPVASLRYLGELLGGAISRMAVSNRLAFRVFERHRAARKIQKDLALMPGSAGRAPMPKIYAGHSKNNASVAMDNVFATGNVICDDAINLSFAPPEPNNHDPIDKQDNPPDEDSGVNRYVFGLVVLIISLAAGWGSDGVAAFIGAGANLLHVAIAACAAIFAAFMILSWPKPERRISNNAVRKPLPCTTMMATMTGLLAGIGLIIMAYPSALQALHARDNAALLMGVWWIALTLLYVLTHVKAFLLPGNCKDHRARRRRWRLYLSTIALIMMAGLIARKYLEPGVNDAMGWNGAFFVLMAAAFAAWPRFEVVKEIPPTPPQPPIQPLGRPTDVNVVPEPLNKLNEWLASLRRVINLEESAKGPCWGEKREDMILDMIMPGWASKLSVLIGQLYDGKDSSITGLKEASMKPEKWVSLFQFMDRDKELIEAPLLVQFVNCMLRESAEPPKLDEILKKMPPEENALQNYIENSVAPFWPDIGGQTIEARLIAAGTESHRLLMCANPKVDGSFTMEHEPWQDPNLVVVVRLVQHPDLVYTDTMPLENARQT